MRKIKVLLVVNELLRGGGQRIVLDEAKRIDQDRFDLTVVCLKDSTHFTAENLLGEAKEANVRVVDLGGTKGTSFREAWKLWKLIQKEKPDIVHTFLPYAGVIGRSVAWFARVPAIITTQCNLRVAYSRFWFLLDSVTLRLATAWIAVTEGIELSHSKTVSYFSPEAWKAGKRHFTVVAGVDLPSFDAKLAVVNRETKRSELGLTSNDRMVIMIARLIAWKGHEDLVASMAFLPEHIHVFIVGWGPLEEQLKTQGETLGVGKRLHVLGARNDVIELLGASDAFAATHNRTPEGTIWMGANIGQMEGSAARVPAMSTAVPYIENLIQDGVTGLLAEPNNPKDIARAIEYLCDNPVEAKVLAEHARTRVEERYSLAAMMKTYQAIYDLSLSESSR